jgi:7-cyano-7-deazaguanine synthase in queuosine biosynthesis
MNDSSSVEIRATYDSHARSRHGSIVCRIDHDVQLSTAHLESFCFRELKEHDKELVFLAGVIAFADRAIRRRWSEGWRRSIHVVMPVGSPRYWQRPAVTHALQDALGFLSGDVWTFEFVKRTEPLPKLTQPEFDLNDENTIVVPFSNGMDSFAQSKLLKADGFHAMPIRITAKTRAVNGDQHWVTDGDGSRYRRVSIPFSIETSTHPEPTYRTRTFVFAAMAGLAAHLAKSQAIVVPEAGQGSFGPSLVPVGAEAPHRGSHPGFSRRMTALFQALWNEKIPFVHPQLWQTKGEVLRRLGTLNLQSGWQSTYSCSRGPRQIFTDRSESLQCGLCAGCLLRRMSVFSAGLVEPGGQYFWTNLEAPDLKKALCPDAGREPTENDQDIAVHAVMAMEALARAANRSPDDFMFKQNLFDAFDSHETADFEKKLHRLLDAHRKEWRAFTGSLPADAWINQQIAML